MKIVTAIARIWLGLTFLIFGLNGFLHFMPSPPMTGDALKFMMALGSSHYMLPVFACQVAGGVLLLVNRYVPIGLVLLGPILVNIVIFHALMAPSGLVLAALAVALWGIIFYSVRGAFAGLWVAKPETIN